MMNKFLRSTTTPFLVTVIVVLATKTMIWKGKHATAGGVSIDASSSNRRSMDNSNRRLNVLTDLWNEWGAPVVDGIGSAVGGFFGSDEYSIQGDDDDDDDDTSPIIGGGNDDDNNNDGVNWGNDGAWQDWLARILDGGFFDGFLEEITVGGIDLGDGLEFLSNVDFNDLRDGKFDVCTVIELAIGMTPTFGRVANCDCEGNFRTGMEINCSFEGCAPFTGSKNNAVCGAIDIGFEFGTPDGKVKGTACADVSMDRYDETCFSYVLDVRDNDDVQKCEATYGGNPCDCSIDQLCLSMDCSPHLEGGTMETCQMLSMIEADDIANWFPNFEAFLPGRDEDNNNNDFEAFLPAPDDDDEDDDDDDDLIDWEAINSVLPATTTGGIDDELIVLQANELVNSSGGSSSSSRSSPRMRSLSSSAILAGTLLSAAVILVSFSTLL